jgi:hypothetical protein
MNYNDIVERLKSLGYIPTVADEYSINFAIKKGTSYFRNFTHISDCEEIPESALPDVIDWICGYFLQEKTAIVDGENSENSGIIKSVKRGSETVEWDTSTSAEAKVSALYLSLISNAQNAFLAYRRLSWGRF